MSGPTTFSEGQFTFRNLKAENISLKAFKSISKSKDFTHAELVKMLGGASSSGEYLTILREEPSANNELSTFGITLCNYNGEHFWYPDGFVDHVKELLPWADDGEMTFINEETEIWKLEIRNKKLFHYTNPVEIKYNNKKELKN